jgi:secondary thiamine-phosphate synthase enzyme
MQIHARTFSIETAGLSDVHDLTPRITAIAGEAHINKGLVNIFVPGSTAGITTLEYEEGAIEDLKAAIERLVPSRMHYAHDARWGDGNGFSHIRAALFGPSLTVPIVAGSLSLGTWQQIILVDFDNRPRRREVVVQCLGE